MNIPMPIRAMAATLLLAALPPAPRAAPPERPPTMLAWRMHAIGGPEVLSLDRVPVPQPTAGAVLVRVRAAAVNPGDWKLHTGRMRLQPKLPHTMGVDFAGIVEAVGTDVHDWQRGDAVYGFVPLETGGAQATFVVAQPGNLRRKPPGLSFTAAAAIPVAALTAWKSLFELGALRADQRLLVQGASGAVGSAAVQLASRAGAHVAGTASASNLEYLRSLGVDPAIDYRAQRFEETAHDYDMVLDAVGGETTERSLATLRRGGTIVTLSSFADPGRCANLGLRCVFNPSFVPAGAGFDAIDALVQRGQLTVPVGQAYPLREAAAALAAVRAGSGHGRIVLTMEERP